MAVYITLLRGINVSGKNIVKMPDLVKLFASMGFTNVRSYIQSGNIIFDYKTVPIKSLTGLIKSKIKNNLKMDIPVLIRTSADMKKIIGINPFLKENKTEKLHVTFLEDFPDSDLIKSIDKVKSGTESYSIIDREIYLFCPEGYGITKMNNSYFEKLFKQSATTRNWKTVCTLYDMSAKKEG
jgi:uncharacterized protein (DUF1697 family)